MELLNPTLLTGMVAGALPIIIHLIQRKRAPEHVFPPTELLKDARQKISRRIRLRHLLVMLLRVLFIVLLAAALARPFIQKVKTLRLSESPVACAVVIDDSLSMRYKAPGKNSTVFSTALKRAKNTLGELRDFDQSVIVTFSGREVGSFIWDSNHQNGIEGLEELRPGYGIYEAGIAIGRARELLAKVDMDEKKLVVFSDFCRSSWSRTDFDLLTADGIDVSMPELVEPGSDADNRHFKEVGVDSSQEGIEVRSEIETTGKFEGADFDVKLFVGEMLRDQKKVTRDQSARETELAAEIDGREYSGRLKLPPDPLLADNVLYLAGRVNTNVEVLLVNGDPHENIYRNETYYMDMALSGEQGRLKTSVVTPARLEQVVFANYDCVVFANVRPSDLPPKKRMRDYLRQGGGLWFVLGDQAKSSKNNDNVSEQLMPVTIKNVQKTGQGENARIQISSPEHPIFQPFSSRWLQEFTSAAFNQWWLMEPKSDAEVMMELDNGHPLLVGWRPGGGGVFVLSSPLGREWNDFCLQPVFVPFMQRAVRFMADSLPTAKNRRLWINESYELEMPDRESPVYVHPPAASDAERLRIIEEADGVTMRYKETQTPGLYTVSRDEKGDDVISRFVVNIPPEASDMRRWRDKEVQTRRLVSQQDGTDEAGDGANNYGFWAFLLWACAVTLLAESVLARW